MSKPVEHKPLLAVLGAGFAVTLGVSPLAGAAGNPFGAVSFAVGTQVAAEGGCGAGAQGGCGAMSDDDDSDSDSEDDSQN